MAKKTVFNYVATYNDFERRFAGFLDNKASDGLRFAALGTTEQGESGTLFRVEYLKRCHRVLAPGLGDRPEIRGRRDQLERTA